MIKIIKPGFIKSNTYETTCTKCGCIFEYQKEDVERGPQQDYYEDVKCPYCKEDVDVRGNKRYATL